MNQIIALGGGGFSMEPDNLSLDRYILEQAGKDRAKVCFLPDSCCPHYDSEAERRPTFHRLLAAEQILPGYGIDDGAALHIADGELLRVVSSRSGATAYALEKVAGEVRERPLECEYLGGD